MKKKLLFLFVCTLFFFSQLSAQTRAVTGLVKDEMNEGLPAASVTVKGSTSSVSTDENGRYQINVSDNAILVFQYVGFISQEIPVNGRSEINVDLMPDTQILDDVVVVGYGTQRKSDLTGAISSINAKDLEKATPVNATQALQGRAAGVMVSTNTGSPGSEGVVRIRGIGSVNDNNPIYVVDGMFVQSINYLNPSDIQSIEVLKDASATAIYGSRGANGVILVTTQKGTNSKSIINVNANVGISNMSNFTDLLNREQYYDYMKTAVVNGYLRSFPGSDPNIDPTVSTNPYFDTFKIVKQEYDKGYNTDWVKELVQSNALIQSYDIALRGGSDQVRYNLSAGYFNQDGLIQNSSYDRYTFRLNTDYDVGKRLVFGQNIGVTSSKTIGYPAEGVLTPIGGTLYMDPLTPVINPNADLNDPNYMYNKYAGTAINATVNPVAQAARNNYTSGNYQMVGNGYGQLEIVKDLKFRTSLGFDYSNINQSNFSPKYYIKPLESASVNSLTQNKINSFGLVWENTLNYSTIINNDHSITGLLGYSQETYKANSLNTSKNDIPTNDPYLQVPDAATGTASVNGNKSLTSLRSVFARVNYSYADKYLLTVSVRRDGSSKFGEGQKWGTFPSFSAGWRIINEKFFQDLNATFISDLKIRAGWGQIGSQSMPGGNNNPYLSLIQSPIGYRYVFGDAAAPGYYLSAIGTPLITWETSQQTNIGMDVGLLRNRLTLSADYFVKNTKDMLLQVPVPNYSGFPSLPYTNAGEVQNKGIELVVNFQDQVGDFTYGISANASKFVNKAISLGVGNRPIVSDFNRTEVGSPIGQFYGWVTDGIFQSTEEIQGYNKGGVLIQPMANPGDFRFKDLNGDGVINANDQTFIGSPFPDLLYGLNLSLGYKNIDFTAFFQGSYGNQIWNVNRSRTSVLAGVYNGSVDAYEKAWRGPGTSNSQPIISTLNRNDNFRNSDWYIEDGSYLRLKNLQVGYNLPLQLANKISMRSARLWIGGSDLFTITNYTGIDPEVGLNSNPISGGRDSQTYPKMRRFTFGISATLN